MGPFPKKGGGMLCGKRGGGLLLEKKVGETVWLVKKALLVGTAGGNHVLAEGGGKGGLTRNIFTTISEGKKEN